MRIGMDKFLRNSGRLAIDFALTGPIDGRPKLTERLREPADLEAWLASVERVPAAPPSPCGLAEARRLRSAIATALDAVLDGRAIPPSAIEHLNRVSRRGAAAPVLLPNGAVEVENQTFASVLASIAHDAILLVGSADQRNRLRECANPECPRIFFDHSPPGRRRWCSGQTCGDVVRARAYRRRRAAAN
jgi:predicted RNA-binding Zn ribbon-like protein